MGSNPKYAKTSQVGATEYVHLLAAPDADTPVTLQVTLGEMDLEDAFRVTLPLTHARMRLGELLEQVFGENESAQNLIRAGFDLKENPDLPEMYDALQEIYREWRSGRCTLEFMVNHGSEIALSDELWPDLMVRRSEVQGGLDSALLDLVVEQEYRPLDYAVEQGYADSKAQLLEWLQARTLLYFLDTQDLKLEVDPTSGADQALLAIANLLCQSNHLTQSQETHTFAITMEGRQELANMIAETETYIDRFDVFQDVIYDLESGSATFDSGRGEDLRVPVYEAEGLDPVRVVFLLILYNSELDSQQSKRREAIAVEDFYQDILTAVVDHQDVDRAHLESIIESGYAYVEEREEEARRLAARRVALASAKGHSAPSRRDRHVNDAVPKLPSR